MDLRRLEADKSLLCVVPEKEFVAMETKPMVLPLSSGDGDHDNSKHGNRDSVMDMEDNHVNRSVTPDT